MQVTVGSRDKNDKNDKLSVNNGDFSCDYFSNSNVRMANTNDTKILYILSAFSSNSPPDFSIISQRDRVIYVADVLCKAGFASLTDIFVGQLCNFSNLKVDWLHVVQSIMYKPELERTQNFL